MQTNYWGFLFLVVAMFSFLQRSNSSKSMGTAFKDIMLKPVANGIVSTDTTAKSVSELFTRDTVIYVVRRPG
jgi:hypothetical protein